VCGIALLLVLALILAACGSGGGDGGGGNDKGARTGESDTGKPVPGGNLVYSLEADTTGGWCLAEAQLAIAGIQVARAIYDTLTAPDGDGNIKPFLAESVTPNADSTVWTIKLRPNIKFHDGTPLTAQVVKDNIDAYRGKLPERHPLLFTFVFSDITKVEATTADTVTVTTKRPWPAFPWFLWSSGRLGIMADAQLKDPKNCNTNMIGTGPFTKASWTPNEQFVAKKNPNYWRKDADGVQLPYLDQITFIPQENGPERVKGLEAGDYTVIHTSGPQEISQIRKDVDSGKLKDTESDKFAEVGYTMLNTTKAPFNNQNARDAFAFAVDRDVVNKVRYNDILTNATGPFAEDVTGYLADTGLPTFDLQKAKDAAAKYKQETGQDLSFGLSHTSDPETTKTAQLIQSMLKTAGINANLVPVPDQSTLINQAIARNFDSVLWRNHPGADPDTQYVWWHCDNAPPAACDNPVNFGGYNNAEINKLLDDGRVELDPAKRKTIYEDLNKAFAKDLPNLWGQWTLWAVAYQPNVHGIMGPDLPDGSKPFTGLATGHPVEGMWLSK
jgi:peptide/nickel transport system substrate-binding protein